MTDCHVCGSPTNVDGPPYRCAYCGRLVCEDHRLPENHRCSGSRLPDDESVAGREPKRMNLETERLPGSTPKDTGLKSPDVAIDGSVVGAEEDDTESSEPWWKRLWPF